MLEKKRKDERVKKLKTLSKMYLSTFYYIHIK